MADYVVNENDLTSIADAIRTKSGTTASLSFPTEFVSAIENISSGCSGTTMVTVWGVGGSPLIYVNSSGETQQENISSGGSIDLPLGSLCVSVNAEPGPFQPSGVELIYTGSRSAYKVYQVTG